MTDRFPLTRASLLLAARSPDEGTRQQALDALVTGYWRPVYKYLRLRWQAAPEDAQDLTQGFFTAAIEKGFFDRYDPGKARFRTWLRTCLDGFVSHERESARRLKRGGGSSPLSLDFESAEGELRRFDVPDGFDMEEYFHKEWVRHLFGLAVERFRGRCEAQGHGVRFALFQRYDLEGPDHPQPPSYAELAAEFGLPVTQVTNHLAWARRQFREAVLETLRDATASEEEFRAEARLLLGVAAT
jgi:RNA polymerase sigma factor (sigma-70 family)